MAKYKRRLFSETQEHSNAQLLVPVWPLIL